MKKNRLFLFFCIISFFSVVLGLGYVHAESPKTDMDRESVIIQQDLKADQFSGIYWDNLDSVFPSDMQAKDLDGYKNDGKGNNLIYDYKSLELVSNLPGDYDYNIDKSIASESKNLPLKTEDGMERREDGLWYTNINSQNSFDHNRDSTRTIQGPDQFGYVGEDAYPYSWIDVSGGMETGINNETEYAGPFEIGFDFKFYTNTYSHLYISRNGYISFNDLDLTNPQSYIPDPELPNDVIAPMWGPSESINYVRYKYQGSEPNRQMIIEWNQQANDTGTEIFTFQAILHENGDIVFQYHSIISDGVGYCTSSGIEDSEGVDGLPLKDMCERFWSEEAARIYRPEPGARFSLLPESQSDFIRLNTTLHYQLTIKNLGDLGPDVFDLEVATDWPVDLYASDGSTLLTDTNGNGMVDTGPVAVGETIDLIVSITPPIGANIGDSNSTIITATSNLDVSVFKESSISMAYPTNFVQSYFDGDSGGGVYLVHPKLQTESLPNWWTPSMGVVETANGNLIYAANKQHYDSGLDSWITEMHRTVFDKYGNVIRSSESLTSITPSEFDVWELDPALAAAPNGNVGILWDRETLDESTNTSVYNIFFAIIDESGQLIYGPENLTNNTVMGQCWSDENIPCYYRPQIAVTDDGKFAIAYQQSILESSLTYQDVYFGIRNSDGTEFSGLTNLTRGLTGSEENTNPTLTSLDGNEFLLAWNSDGISYTVLNSSGVETFPTTSISTNMYLSDSIQLSDGKIFLAGYDYIDYENEVHYLLLDNVTYSIVVPATSLVNPHAKDGNYFVSVTRDQNAHAVLTWNGYDSHELYYSLVGSDGSVVTAPFVFRSSNSIFMDTSETGYGNTTYSTEIEPFTGCADMTAIPVAECNALEALYNSTNGDQWKNNQGWFVLADPGTWYGISVTAGHVTAIDLNGNDLNGIIPVELGNFSDLTDLNLSWNYQLSGSIPSELGSLSNLNYLNLNGNELSGAIPQEFGNLSNLTYLSLAYNQLSEGIPLELGNLSNLTILHLADNRLNGGIPSVLGNLANLTVLDISFNRELSGEIPPELGNLSNLSILNLGLNSLIGEIPSELGNLSNLKNLDLFMNQLTGSIPAELGNLSNLINLNLGVNQLSGGIPTWIGNLTNLTELYLGHNQLGGQIPPELGNLNNLNNLILNSAQLSGSIPIELGNLSNLVYLYLGYNQLDGEIPSGFGNLTNLMLLVLDNNDLSGDIPTSFTNLVNLCTPEDNCYGIWDYGLDLGYNGLNVPALEPVASFLEEKDPDWDLTQAVEETISGDSGGIIISNDNSTQIEVPPDAVTGNVSFLYEPEPYPNQFIGNLSFAGISFQLTAEDSVGSSITFFNEPLLITLNYAEEYLGNIPEEELYLYYWDEGMTAWVDVVTTCGSGSYQRDFEENWLSVPVCHLSEFALMGHANDLENQIFMPLVLR